MRWIVALVLVSLVGTVPQTPAGARVSGQITILEPSGSWFDPHRLNRIAFNNEPLNFPDFSTDAKLVHHFERGGAYLVSVAAFEGQWGESGAPAEAARQSTDTKKYFGDGPMENDIRRAGISCWRGMRRRWRRRSWPPLASEWGW